MCHKACHGLGMPFKAVLASCRTKPRPTSAQCQALSPPRKMAQPGHTPRAAASRECPKPCRQGYLLSDRTVSPKRAPRGLCRDRVGKGKTVNLRGPSRPVCRRPGLWHFAVRASAFLGGPGGGSPGRYGNRVVLWAVFCFCEVLSGPRVMILWEPLTARAGVLHLTDAGCGGGASEQKGPWEETD